MQEKMEYTAARELLLGLVRPVGAESVPLAECAGRVLAADLLAAQNVPAFDRSSYDGYAFRAADAPATLRVVMEVAAGTVPRCALAPGTAAKVLTGAAIPTGADAVEKYENTHFTADRVGILAPARPGQNIIRAGEDMRAGTLLAPAGTRIDAGLAAVLAAQGVAEPMVYRRPLVGIIATGSELVPPGQTPAPGQIGSSGPYAVAAELQKTGCQTELLGIVPDWAEAIAEAISKAMPRCDALLLTGGVSVGDYDCTPAGMALAGAEVLVRGVRLKPGMACAYGRLGGRLICGLSGSPTAALANLYVVVLPALRRLCGLRQCCAEEIPLTLAEGFAKPSPVTRLLRGRLELSTGKALLRPAAQQANSVVSSSIGCNAAALVPAGSGPLPEGTVLTGFLL